MHELYTVQQIIDTFSPGNPEFVGIIIAFAIANAIGLIEYIWAVAINIKEHKTPFPAWAHTFFFAHDFTAGVVCTIVAVYNAVRFSKFPPKTKEMGNYKNKPIW